MRFFTMGAVLLFSLGAFAELNLDKMPLQCSEVQVQGGKKEQVCSLTLQCLAKESDLKEVDFKDLKKEMLKRCGALGG